MSKVYEIVTNRIIKKLEEGTVPWRKPWVGSGTAVSWKTQKPYRGINTLLLDPGEYATFKQIKEAGGKVKKGAESHIVVFWKMLGVDEEKEDGSIEEIQIPYMQYYRVFEINTQVEGLDSKRVEKEFDHDPIEEAEKVVKGYMDAPEIRTAPGSAYYKPSMDYVSMPPIKHFYTAEEYYSVLFHELAHSTGHKDRLNRNTITSAVASFGSEDYSKEELVAEMSAAMLCGRVGIENITIENSAAYIQSWLRKLKDDKKFVVQAAGLAQRAVDYMLGVTYEKAAR